MQDTDTATIELTRSEAREVINALSSHMVAASGRDERRALNVREFLQREFDFEDRHFDEGTDINELFLDIFDSDDGDHEIQLSRAEASEVLEALVEEESEAEPSEREAIADLRDRLEERFDLDADAAR